MIEPLRLSLSAALLAALVPAHHAHAATVTRDQTRNAVEVCQGALPSFEGSLRKRPTAISNEGANTAFISCSLESANSFSAYKRTQIQAGIVNWSGAAQTVNCTLVDGANIETVNTYHPKSFLLPANDSVFLVWSTIDKPGGFTFPNLSCALPPGVEIGALTDTYPEEVGN